MTLRAADLYAQPIIVGTTDELTEAFALDANVPVGVNYVPPNRQIVKDVTTGLEYVGDGVTAYSDLTPLPGGGSGGLPIADTTGAATATTPNTLTGEGDITFVTFPAETTAWAVGIEGEDFPRIACDAAGSMWFGDGTFDPYDAGATFDWGLVGRGDFAGLRLYSPDGMQISSDMWIEPGKGPIVVDDTDGNLYRLGTHNGTPTATQVT